MVPLIWDHKKLYFDKPGSPYCTTYFLPHPHNIKNFLLAAFPHVSWEKPCQAQRAGIKPVFSWLLQYFTLMSVNFSFPFCFCLFHFSSLRININMSNYKIENCKIWTDSKHHRGYFMYARGLFNLLSTAATFGGGVWEEQHCMRGKELLLEGRVNLHIQIAWYICTGISGSWPLILMINVKRKDLFLAWECEYRLWLTKQKKQRKLTVLWGKQTTVLWGNRLQNRQGFQLISQKAMIILGSTSITQWWIDMELCNITPCWLFYRTTVISFLKRHRFSAIPAIVKAI